MFWTMSNQWYASTFRFSGDHVVKVEMDSIGRRNTRIFAIDALCNTVEDDIIVDQVDAPEIVDDFELGQDEAVDIKDKDVNKQKLRRRIDQYKIELRNPCREGKKLLVLDIDYTLFDHRSTAENPLELMRPYLHEFLTAAYAEYDIMIWSATSMKWVELKMGQLGVLSNPNYKITALLDHLAMITVQSDSRGIFDCKPLGLIWALFPEVARILLFVYMFYHVYLHFDQVIKMHPFGFVLVFTMPAILTALNLMWFGKIVKGLIKDF